MDNYSKLWRIRLRFHQSNAVELMTIAALVRNTSLRVLPKALVETHLNNVTLSVLGINYTNVVNLE